MNFLLKCGPSSLSPLVFSDIGMYNIGERTGLRLYRDSNIKSTPSVHPDRLARLGLFYQQNTARLDVGSTPLSFTLPPLKLAQTSSSWPQILAHGPDFRTFLLLEWLCSTG
jgi:hypothetical protein